MWIKGGQMYPHLDPLPWDYSLFLGPRAGWCGGFLTTTLM